MIFPPDYKNAKPEKFKCQVCHEEYLSSLEALRCPEIHGFPKQNFKIDDRVICIAGPDKGTVGVLISIRYARPGHLSRKPHTPIFNIRMEKRGTTAINTINQSDQKYIIAHEGEIEIYKE